MVGPPKQQHPYTKIQDNLIPFFQKFANEGPADGWQNLGDQKGIKITQKLIPGTPNGVLKGVGYVEGASPIDLLAIISSPDARPHWDSMFESGKLVEILDEYHGVELGYAVAKAVWPTSARDFAVLVVTEEDKDGTIRSAVTSIENPKIPPVDGRVRGELNGGGWSFEKRGTGTDIVFVSQSDPKGWVPASVLQLASSQIPLCVAGVRDYFTKFGPPPFTAQASGKILMHSFNHDSSKYDMKFNYNPNPYIKATEIFISPRRYPGGFNASISPETGFVAKWNQTKNRLVLIHIEGTKSQNFEVTISKENSKSFVPLVNGREIVLLDEDQENSSEGPQTKDVVPSKPQNLTKDESKPDLETPKADVGPPPRKRHAFSDAADSLMKTFEQLKKENESHGWIDLGSRKGAQLGNKPGAGPTGYLRGLTTVPGATPMEALGVVYHGSVRKIWDELFDYGELIEDLDFNNRISLIYASTKPFWPTSSRDLVVVQEMKVKEDGTILLATKSVEDSRRPEVQGKVRAISDFAGWSFTPTSGGIELLYISQSDPKGWVPSSALKAVSSQIPLCVATVRDYLVTHGPPSFPLAIAGPQESVSFDHETSKLSVVYKNQPTQWAPATQIFVSPKRYPQGVNVTVTPQAGLEFQWNEAKSLLVVTPTSQVAGNSVVDILVTKANHSSFKVFVNNQSVDESLPSPSMVSLASAKPQEDTENEESDNETSFSDANGTPPPKIKHRHAARADEVCELFEKMLNEGERDGWAKVSDLQGVAIWKKPDDSPTGIMKGIGIVDRAKPYEVIAVATTIDTRSHWDALFDTARLVEVLDPYYRVNMTYGATKSTMASSSRDISLVQVITEKPNGTLMNITGSIVDSKLPEVSGKVRAYTEITGWCFRPHARGTEVVYISKSNPKGWLPPPVLKMVANSVPLCVAGVRDYLQKYGAPPFVTKLAGETVNTTFDHNSSEFGLYFNSRPSPYAPVSKVFVPTSRYPLGIDVTLSTGDKGSATWNSNKELLIFKTIQGSDVKLTINKRSSGPFSVTWNGRQIFPVESSSMVSLSSSVAAPTLTSGEEPASNKAPIKVTHKYSAKIEEFKAEFLRVLKDSQSGSWTSAGTQKGIHITRKLIPNHPMGGFVKGEGTIIGFTPGEVMAVQTNFTCKKIWDPLLDSVHMIEGLNQTDEIQHVIMKGQMGVSSRDLTVTWTVEKQEDGSILSFGSSIVDSRVPETSKSVRVDCTIAGWYYTPVHDRGGSTSCRVEYFSLSDVKGWIPGALLKMIVTQVPLSIAEIDSFLQKYGPPPYYEALAGKLTEPADFDNNTSGYGLKYKHIAGLDSPTVLKFSKKRYPSGCDITVSPSTVEVAMLPSNDGISVLAKSLPDDTLVSVRATKKSGGSFSFVVNGKPPTSQAPQSSQASQSSQSVERRAQIPQHAATNGHPPTQPAQIQKEIASFKERAIKIEGQLLDSQQPAGYSPVFAFVVSFLFLLVGVYLSRFLESLE